MDTEILLWLAMVNAFAAFASGLAVGVLWKRTEAAALAFVIGTLFAVNAALLWSMLP